MAGFLYFIPGVGACNANLREQLGLSHIAEPKREPAFCRNTGPSGGSGVFLFRTEDQHIYGANKYDPKKTEWRKVDLDKPVRGISAWYLGWIKNEMPKVLYLARSDRSIEIEYMHPEFQWAIPGQKAIPREMRLVGASAWTERVLPQHRELAEIALELFNIYLDGKDIMAEVPKARQCDICVRALGLLYRIGPVEADTMRLLDEQTRYYILSCLIDRPRLTNADDAALELKKNELCELIGICPQREIPGQEDTGPHTAI